ncbi:tyrosine-type recombinase/integrase [Mycolicibacterium fluoranthenivorans]|uniref:Tyrosine-type recombinase/integrase n=1 Tax=Mycolicibacterium fluoranthenivorans TaxID=258505 RepID=A0A7G8P8R6_9MYCO|nr:tyrosine-type recombinase/integrase [Mycolicibacterium fluoranthenivorans]QNJ90732.1 tyrosine-type recombinase/integrase [Mycolicibacterium fluoranthenivorans]
MAEHLLDLAAEVPSWKRALRAAGKSDATLATYGLGVDRFLRWCADTGTPAELTKANVQAWLADLLDSGLQATSATTWLGGVKRFGAWLAEEDLLPDNPVARLSPPKVPTKVTESLSDDELRRLLKTCQGSKSLRDRRDEAIIRLMSETGLRANELVGLQLADLDLERQLATVTRGKGGKGRIVPFSPQVATALDRYLRVRRGRARPDNTQLFVGAQAPGFQYWALAATLRRRAVEAGVQGFHVHKLRHTAATRWLRAGGSEGGLMAVAGWSDRSMLDRYVQASAAERAAAEARGLNLGDL